MSGLFFVFSFEILLYLVKFESNYSINESKFISPHHEERNVTFLATQS